MELQAATQQQDKQDEPVSGNSFGTLFRLTTFGESHGAGLGGIIDGCPAGISLDESRIQAALDRRRPGKDGAGGAASTARREPDAVRLLSGIFEGKTTGTPIAFVVENTDQRSHDYGALADIFRPGHADLGFQEKFGLRDPRGGGRSSGRETIGRVAGGAVAAVLLEREGIYVRAWTMELGGIAARHDDPAGAAGRAYFSPDAAAIPAWEERLAQVAKDGDTVGGLVRIEAFGLPAGLGEPVFDKLDARLAAAFMSVGAVKGVEIGRGFAAARLLGSENNDAMLPGEAVREEEGHIGAARPLRGGKGYGFASNNAGGILGGISTGAPVSVTVAVKPIASIAKKQNSIGKNGEGTSFSVGGRHDVCAIPRIVPVLEAMAALSLADFVLLQRSRNGF